MKLTNGQFKALKDFIKVSIDETVEEKELVTKGDISHLPTKSEFFDRMDKVMGELKTIREQQTIITGQYSRIADHLKIS